jgi:hypothetical protein
MFSLRKSSATSASLRFDFVLTENFQPYQAQRESQPPSTFMMVPLR